MTHRGCGSEFISEILPSRYDEGLPSRSGKNIFRARVSSALVEMSAGVKAGVSLRSSKRNLARVIYFSRSYAVNLNYTFD